jgi:hypothetical protein
VGKPLSSRFICPVSSVLQEDVCESIVEKPSWIHPVLRYWCAVRRLAIRPGAIGDFIVSLPALECLVPNSPEDSLEVWTTAVNVPLVRFGAKARALSSTGLNLLGITEPAPALASELASFDEIISWYGSNRPEFREHVAALGLPFTFLPALPTDGSRIHAADFYLRQVRPFAARDSDGIPRIATRAEDSPIVETEAFAVIQPFSGSQRKNWPLERFRDLARNLESQLRVRWCVGAEDPPVPGAVRIDDLYQLACWLSQASLYAGNDSGITHLAAAAGVPVLALFGPTDPTVWAPRGSNVRIGSWGPSVAHAIQ